MLPFSTFFSISHTVSFVHHPPFLLVFAQTILFYVQIFGIEPQNVKMKSNFDSSRYFSFAFFSIVNRLMLWYVGLWKMCKCLAIYTPFSIFRFCVKMLKELALLILITAFILCWNWRKRNGQIVFFRFLIERVEAKNVNVCSISVDLNRLHCRIFPFFCVFMLFRIASFSNRFCLWNVLHLLHCEVNSKATQKYMQK